MTSSISIIGLITVLVILIVCSTFTITGTYIKGDLYENITFLILTPFLAALAIYLLVKNKTIFNKVEFWKLASALFIINSLIGVAWYIFVNDVPVSSDSPDLIDAAITLKNTGTIGHSTMLTDNGYTAKYLSRFPYQSGYVLFLYAVYSVFGRIVTFPIIVMNSLITAGGITIIGLIAMELSNENNGKLAMAICTMFTPIMFMSNRIYPNVTAFPLSMACVLLVIRICRKYDNRDIKEFLKENLLDIVLLILSSFTMVWFKPNTMIFVIGVSIILFLKGRKAWIIMLMVIVSAVIGSMLPISILGNMSGIDFKNDKQPAVTWVAIGTSVHGKIVCDGCFDVTYTEGTWDMSPEKSKSVNANRLKNNIKKISDTEGWPMFFANKMSWMWAEPSLNTMNIKTKETEWEIFRNDVPGVNRLSDKKYIDANPIRTALVSKPTIYFVYTYYDLIQEVFLMLAAMTVFMMFRNRGELEPEQLLPLLVVIGGFVFHSFWEVQPEYAMPYLALLITYVNLDSAAELFSRRTKKAGKTNDLNIEDS